MTEIKVKQRKCITVGLSDGFTIPKALFDGGLVTKGKFYDITLTEVAPPQQKR